MLRCCLDCAPLLAILVVLNWPDEIMYIHSTDVRHERTIRMMLKTANSRWVENIYLKLYYKTAAMHSHGRKHRPHTHNLVYIFNIQNGIAYIWSNVETVFHTRMLATHSSDCDDERMHTHIPSQQRVCLRVSDEHKRICSMHSVRSGDETEPSKSKRNQTEMCSTVSRLDLFCLSVQVLLYIFSTSTE